MNSIIILYPQTENLTGYDHSGKEVLGTIFFVEKSVVHTDAKHIELCSVCEWFIVDISNISFYMKGEVGPWADPEGGTGGPETPPPPWNFGKNVLIGFEKWYWFDIAQHLCKLQS